MGTVPKPGNALIPMLDLKAQYARIKPEIDAAIARVVARQRFILGPEGEALEQEIVKYCGGQCAVGVASGTEALALVLQACGVVPDDEVIVPAFSFVATASAVSMLGAKPVFVDIEPHTYNIDAAQIEAVIREKTTAIIAVHLYGLAADMDPLQSIAKSNFLRLIEDNAQAIGARYRGVRTGTIGDFGCLSFYPTKNLGGYGDGGMVLARNEGEAARIRSLRDQGQSMKYVSAEQGWNSRLDELQAAVLRTKLQFLDDWAAARQRIADRYNDLLHGIRGLVTPGVPEGREHVYHQYTLRIRGGIAKRDREGTREFLSARGVASNVYYPVPLHLQPVYAGLGYRAGQFPEAERAAREVLSLPIYPEMTEEQIERVAEVVRAALN
jgi:dTDP-4-amino-4,6-dideoxygalactose transaminase